MHFLRTWVSQRKVLLVQYQYSVASWTPVPHFHGARSPSDSDEHTTPENRAVTGSYPALTAADVDFSAPYVFQTTTSSFPLSKSDYRKQRRFFKLDRSATFYHNFFSFVSVLWNFASRSCYVVWPALQAGLNVRNTVRLRARLPRVPESPTKSEAKNHCNRRWFFLEVVDEKRRSTAFFSQLRHAMVAHWSTPSGIASFRILARISTFLHPTSTFGGKDTTKDFTRQKPMMDLQKCYLLKCRGSGPS